MKTQKFYTALMLILGIAFAMNLMAMNPVLNGNASNMGSDNNMSALILEYDFEDEPYINDIPFNTECIAKNCIYLKAIAVDFDFEEETYIDDITINTEKISANSNYSNSMNVGFEMEEELYVDDITFNTYSIASKTFLDHYAHIK